MPAHAAAVVEVTLNVPAATAGSSNATALSYREAAGLITFTPVSASDNQRHQPASAVPARAAADVGSRRNGCARLETRTEPDGDGYITNKADAPLSGDADFYAWGLADAQDGALKKSPADVRAIGVQSFPGPDLGLPATERGLIFAVNTWDAWSNPSSVLEMDIFLDVDNDGTDDYVVVGVDQGAVQTGTSNGRYVATVFSTRSAGFGLDFFATAKTDSSTASSRSDRPAVSRRQSGDAGERSGAVPERGQPALHVSRRHVRPRRRRRRRERHREVQRVVAVDLDGRLPDRRARRVGDGRHHDQRGRVGADAHPRASMVVTLDNKNGKDEATLIEAKKK